MAKSSSAPGAKAKKAAAAPTDPKSAASYSLGVSFGTQLHGQYQIGADALAYDRLLQGLKDALAGKAVAGPDDAKRVQTLITQIHDTAGAANKAAADKFLADNGKLPGIITTASGLQYKWCAPARDSPKATDEAVVNYRGTLLDGTEFDSSYKRKEPFTFEVGKVIKGWQEGVQLMKPGSKFELYIPPDLAYGAQSPPPIPPNSLLKFEVELISVKAPAPAAAAAPPGGAMSGPKSRRLRA